MVLALARPEVDERFPELWAERERADDQARPAVASAPASSWCARRSARRRADAVVARIVERADGNAFYLEELIRAVGRRARRRAARTRCSAMVQARLDAEGSRGASACCAPRASSASASRGPASRRCSAARPRRRRVATALERWPRASWSRARRRRSGAATPSTLPPRAGARGRLRHAHRRRSRARPPPRRASGWSRRARATRWRWPSTSTAAASRRAPCAGTARGASRRSSANDLGAAIERAERGSPSGAARREPGALRLIQAEAHVWRGELAEAERQALAAARALAPGGAAWCAPQGEAIIAAGKHGRLDVVEQQVRLPGDTARAADAAAATRRSSACRGPPTTWCSAGALPRPTRWRAGSPRRRSTPRRSSRRRWGWCTRCGRRARRRRAIWPLPQRLESALQAFEQAGDLRNALSVRANLGYVYWSWAISSARRRRCGRRWARPIAWAFTT